MEGTVKISLEDYESLKSQARLHEKQLGELLYQSRIFRGEVTAFLSFLVKKYPLGDSIKAFNEQATMSRIEYDSKNGTVDIELHIKVPGEED